MSTPTYPLATLAFQLTPTGPTAPQASDIVASLQASAQGSLGADLDLDSSAKITQLLGVVAAAVNDANQQAIALANSFSPVYAQGVPLRSLVKINGLTTQASTNSTCTVTIVGVAGTVLPNNQAQDQAGNLWSIPAGTVIPPSGSINVTATCLTAGAITAPINTITTPYNPVPGWQTVTNPGIATIGLTAETDASLRGRQAESTSIAALTPLETILANVANIPGVGRAAIYENPTSSTYTNGVPSHSISVIAEGGNIATIAQIIEAYKSPGTGTYGTTTQTVLDPAGLSVTINFFELTDVPVFGVVTITPLAGYVATTGVLIAQAVAAFIQALNIGETAYLTWLYGPAGLAGNPLSSTFVITSLTIGLSVGTQAAANLVPTFNQAFTCNPANISVVT